MINMKGLNLVGMPANYDRSIYDRFIPPGGGAGGGLTNISLPDTNYSSGFNYARSIAGGIPASQMIAGGVSYSPDQPSGYTQMDLNTPAIPDIGVVPLPQPPFIENEEINVPPRNFMGGGFSPSRLGFNFDNLDFSQMRPNFNFRLEDLDIPQAPQPQVGGLFGTLGKIGQGVNDAQDRFAMFKDNLKSQAIKGLFGI